MEMGQRNKLIRKAYARRCRAFFLAGLFITGGSNNKAEQHIGVHEDYGGNHF